MIAKATADLKWEMAPWAICYLGITLTRAVSCAQLLLYSRLLLRRARRSRNEFSSSSHEAFSHFLFTAAELITPSRRGFCLSFRTVPSAIAQATPAQRVKCFNVEVPPCSSVTQDRSDERSTKASRCCLTVCTAPVVLSGVAVGPKYRRMGRIEHGPRQAPRRWNCLSTPMNWQVALFSRQPSRHLSLPPATHISPSRLPPSPRREPAPAHRGICSVAFWVVPSRAAGWPGPSHTEIGVSSKRRASLLRADYH